MIIHFILYELHRLFQHKTQSTIMFRSEKVT
jgi:hypothetical protein